MFTSVHYKVEICYPLGILSEKHKSTSLSLIVCQVCSAGFLNHSELCGRGGGVVLPPAGVWWSVSSWVHGSETGISKTWLSPEHSTQGCVFYSQRLIEAFGRIGRSQLSGKQLAFWRIRWKKLSVVQILYTNFNNYFNPLKIATLKKQTGPALSLWPGTGAFSQPCLGMSNSSQAYSCVEKWMRERNNVRATLG